MGAASSDPALWQFVRRVQSTFPCFSWPFGSDCSEENCKSDVSLQSYERVAGMLTATMEMIRSGTGIRTQNEQCDGGPGQSRTADQRFRKPLLYPSELRGPGSNSHYRIPDSELEGTQKEAVVNV